MDELQLQAVEFFNRWMKDPNNLGETWGTRQVLAEFAEERVKAEREQIRELTERLHKADGMANEINILTKEIRKLTAELKELREFVGAMNRVAIEEWHGHYQDGEFWFFADDGEGIASGTDPFDAWRKMNAGEGE